MALLDSNDLLLLDVDWQVVLVIPADNVDGFAQTLEDIERQSEGENRVVLAQDLPDVREALAAFKGRVEYALPVSLDSSRYWVEVVNAHAFDAPRTLFVAAGVRLPPSWDARLVAAGQGSPRSAALSPLLSRQPELSAFSSTGNPPKLDVDAVDQWLNDYAVDESFSSPVMPRSCLLLQSEIWRDLAAESLDDVELQGQLKACGYWLSVTPQLYVDDSRCDGVSESPAPQHEIVAESFAQRHPLARVRHALAELDEREERPDSTRSCLPVQLHVCHSWGGGLNRWVENYLPADAAHHHLVLRSIGDRSAFGQQIALYRGADMAVPLRSYTLVQPILSTVVSQLEYARLLTEVIRDFNVESLVVSSFIGHSFDLLTSGLPTAVVMHDFFPYCPALYATFDEPCTACDKARVGQCRKDNATNTFFLHEDEEHWGAIRVAYFNHLETHRPTLIAPSQSVFDRYIALEPRLANLPRHVIPHGLNDALADHYVQNRPPEPPRRELLRIVILGRMSKEKGADLNYALIEQATDVAEFVLLGAGEGGARFASLPGCTVIDDYAMDDLPNQIATASPDVALLLSIVPETYSFTLSELWALGVPVVASRLGAFGDRISEGENGWLVDPEADAVLTVLRQFQRERELLSRVRERLREQPVLKATEMIDHYNRLLPALPGPLVSRYRFPRRSFENPYLQGAGEDQAKLFLERTRGVEATYRSVLSEFLQYTLVKLRQTQRGPKFLRAIVARLLEAVAARVAR